MALTPLDIQNKSFENKFKGYNPDEVDDFLDQVTRDYEELVTKNREMEKALKHAEEKLEYFNELKDALNQSIIVAQDTADKVKESANKEAEVIVSTANQSAKEVTMKADQEAYETVTQAQNKANQILTEASAKAKALAVETEDLKKKTRSFHQRLRLLLESQLDIVNNDEWDELLEPFSSYVGDNHHHVKEMLDKEEVLGVNSNQAVKEAEVARETVEVKPAIEVVEETTETTAEKTSEAKAEETTKTKEATTAEETSEAKEPVEKTDKKKK